MFSRLRRIAAIAAVGGLVVGPAACSSDAVETPDQRDAQAGTTTTVPVLTGSEASPQTDTTVPGSSSDGAPSVETTVGRAIDICYALITLIDGPDDEALDELVARSDQSELVLPAIIRVLADDATGAPVRAAAAARLAAALDDTECELPAGAEGVVLDVDGLDLAPFGSERADAVTALTVVLGAPVVDTGPIDPFSVYGTCGGEQLWAVEWPGLVLLFTDDGAVPERFELTTWRTYRQPDVEVADDQLPRTAAAVGVGSTLDDVETAYPQAERAFDILIDADSVVVDDLMLFLAGEDSEVVGFAEAGFVCGE